EGDPVDEEPLPELERRWRGLLQPREVRQVAAEGVPALGLSLARLRPPPPHADPGQADPDQRRVGDRAAPERDDDDVAHRGAAERQPSMPIQRRTIARTT